MPLLVIEKQVKARRRRGVAKAKHAAAPPQNELQLEGDGLFDFFKARNDYNNTSRKTLDMYGNWPVVEIKLQRTPVKSMLTKALNFISLGKFGELSKKHGYDKYFHLAILLTVVGPDGTHKILTVEKNHVININTVTKNAADAEIAHVPIVPGLTLNNMLNRAKAKMGDTFFKYDAFTYNCQHFIKNVLEESGLLNRSLENWLYQDVTQIGKELPALSFFARKLTDVAAVADKLMGNGLSPVDFVIEEYLDNMAKPAEKKRRKK